MTGSIAHYKILGHLGAGGLGEVYRARDTRLGRTVAVKVLPPALTADPARMERLLATTKRLEGLSHPSIASLFESGQDGDQTFLVFEFVQGQPLSDLVNGRSLNIRRALDFAINLADGLADAHGVELIHGDIRPDTIMVTPKDRAKFMNFGLVEFTAGGATRKETALPYVSPEELAGSPADARSDIYSLGAVVFEMLTGRQRARGLVLSNLNRKVPPELDQVVGRMLAANVETRAQSAAVIATELRSIAAVLDLKAEAAEAVAEPLVRARAGQRRTGVMAVLLLVAVAGALAAWFFVK
jgi:serine/threonine-protein kinase